MNKNRILYVCLGLALIMMFFSACTPPYYTESEKQAVDYLGQYTDKCVVKSKTARRSAVELNLEVRLRDDNTDFINELSELDGVHSAVLVSYNGDYMG